MSESVLKSFTAHIETPFGSEAWEIIAPNIREAWNMANRALLSGYILRGITEGFTA